MWGWIRAVAVLVATAGCGGRALQAVDGSFLVDGPKGFDGPSGFDGAVGFDGLRDLPARPDGVGFDGSVIEGTQCHGLPNSAPYIIPETRPAGAAPPDLAGGTIIDGRYELIAAVHYPADAATPEGLMQRTVQFELDASHWLLTEFVRAAGGGAGTNVRAAAAITVAADGRLTAMFDSCYPASANEYRFEATPDTITMWHERTRMLLYYLRVPG